MPVTVEEDLAEGLRSQKTEAGGLTFARTFHFRDLEGSGYLRFLSAWGYVGTSVAKFGGGTIAIPAEGHKEVVAGLELFARDFNLDPWGDADAFLNVAYREDETALGGSGVEIETGTIVELGETDFDATNQLLPWAERTPMYIVWNPAVDGASVDSKEFRVGARLPCFIGKPFRRYTKTLSSDPGILSETYTAHVNRTAWKGYPPESVLCMGIVGRNSGEGFRTTFDFAIDRITLWRQIFRATNKRTGLPEPLTPAQVAGYNGIKDFLTQKTIDFNALPI